MEQKLELVKVDTVTIECPVNNNNRFVAIKPVCELLGIDDKSQRNTIDEHPVFSSTRVLIPLVAGDGRTREMVCLPLKHFFGWLFSIHPNKVKDEVRENLIKYQNAVCDALYEQFVLIPEFHRIKAELRLQASDNVEQINSELKAAKTTLQEIESISYDEYKYNKSQLKFNF